MKPRIKLRSDLERISIDGFALALGIAPPAQKLRPPQQGYTVSFVAAQDDEPDTYSFHIVASHERLAGILERVFELLPDEVFAIVEIGSRDAYRATDTYISDEPISREQFLQTWHDFAPFLLEDSCIAAGANSEEPFVEVFLDQWKGLVIHVPPDMRDEVETMLQELGLDEVQQTWPDRDDFAQPEADISPADLAEKFAALDESALANGNDEGVRQVLDLSDPNAPDVDELLLDLRHVWKLALNIDPDMNVDESGRDLGSTLWHAIVIMDRVPGDGAGNGAATSDQNVAPKATPQPDMPTPLGGYASIWATAASINQMEQMIRDALEKYADWAVGEIYTIDRVAFDERPEELAHLTPNRREPQVHLVSVEPWGELEKRAGGKS